MKHLLFILQFLKREWAPLVLILFGCLVYWAWTTSPNPPADVFGIGNPTTRLKN